MIREENDPNPPRLSPTADDARVEAKISMAEAIAANGNYARDRVQYLERVLTEHNRQYPHGTPGHVIYDQLNPFAAL